MLQVIRVPAGSRLVSGRLDQVNVAASAGVATSVEPKAIPIATTVLMNLFITLLRLTNYLNVIGIKMSRVRSPSRVWSALTVIAHLTFVQSNFPIRLVILTCCEKRPPGRYSMARAWPYGGGLDEIQYEDSPTPSLFTPPPHGVGS